MKPACKVGLCSASMDPLPGTPMNDVTKEVPQVETVGGIFEGVVHIKSATSTQCSEEEVPKIYSQK